SAYPDATTQRLATAVVKADLLRFDLSDLTPQSFGGSTNADEWRLLQDFLAHPTDPAGTPRELEGAARKDVWERGWPRPRQQGPALADAGRTAGSSSYCSSGPRWSR